MFGDIEAEKHKFHQHKSPILIGDVSINKIIVSNKVPFGKKSFIGYKFLLATKKLDHYASKNECIQKRFW